MYFDIIWFIFSCSTLEYEENKRKEPIYILIISLSNYVRHFRAHFREKKEKKNERVHTPRLRLLLGLALSQTDHRLQLKLIRLNFVGLSFTQLSQHGGVNIINYGDGGGSQPNKLVYGPCYWDHFLQLKIELLQNLDNWVHDQNIKSTKKRD